MMMLLAAVSCETTDIDSNITGSIYGKVTDAVTGEMIASATITITPSGTSTTTGSDGTFEFANLDPDQYSIQVQKSGYNSNSKTINVIGGNTSSGDITIAPISSSSKIELSTSVITLSEECPSQSITINNIGNSGTASWNITEINVDWITISPKSGDTAEGKYSTVILTADFDKISKSTTTNVIVNADGESIPLMIKVNKDGDSEVTTPEPNPDPDQGGDDNDDDQGTLTQGLFVHYTFENNTEDQTDTGLTAKVMGNITYVDNPIDGSKAVKFSKIEESYLNIGDGCVDGYKNTVSFWANGLTDGNIYYANRTNGVEIAFCLSLYEGSLNYIISSYTNFYNMTGATFEHSTITDGWHMITITTDKSGFSTATSDVYIDGEYWHTATTDLMAGDFCAEYDDCKSFQIGGSYSSNLVTRNAIAMTIDNFRIYDTRILSAAEIKALYELENK